MEILDFHMHPPLDAGSDICQYGGSVPYTPEGLLLDLQRAGISRFCGSLISAGRDPDDAVRASNERMLALHDSLGGAYIPGAVIHPSAPDESKAWLRVFAARGLRLVGELVPYMHGWGCTYDSEGLFEILEEAEKLSMVVCYHSTDNDPSEERMIAAHPRIGFVAAHPGEKGRYLAHLSRMEKYENLYLDLSGTGLFRYGMLAYGVKRLGAERFLFGSDYPICNPKMNIAAVEYEDLTEKERALIFGGNARRLLGLT